MGRLWVSERDAVGYAFEPLSVKEAKRTCGPSDAEYALWPKFSPCDVAKHSTLNDGWVIVFERVFDITTFALTHPGFHNAGQVSTALAIARTLGQDATDEFVAIHSRTAWKQLHDFQVGVLRRPGDDEATTTTGSPDVVDDGECVGVHVKPPSEKHPGPEKTKNTHPTPSWLSGDRDFWKRYSGGVTAQVLAYLGAQGYPQGERGDPPEARGDAPAGAGDGDAGTRTRPAVGGGVLGVGVRRRWGRKAVAAVIAVVLGFGLKGV